MFTVTREIHRAREFRYADLLRCDYCITESINAAVILLKENPWKKQRTKKENDTITTFEQRDVAEGYK